MKALKTRAEIESGLENASDKLKAVMRADKVRQVRAQPEPLTPVSGNLTQPVSPPPSAIDTKR